MKINAILAVDAHNGIGRNNTIPWKFAADMAFFREKTLGQHLVLGRNTFASLGNRCLGNRKTHTVIQSKTAWWQTLDERFENAGCHINFMTVDMFLQAYGRNTAPDYEAWVVGGARLYAEFFKRQLVHSIYLTRIHADYDCDVHVELPDSSDYNISIVKEICSADGVTGTIQRWDSKQHNTAARA